MEIRLMEFFWTESFKIIRLNKKLEAFYLILQNKQIWNLRRWHFKDDKKLKERIKKGFWFTNCSKNVIKGKYVYTKLFHKMTQQNKL